MCALYTPCEPVVRNLINIVSDTTTVTELVSFSGKTLGLRADKQNINDPVTIDRNPYKVNENFKAGFVSEQLTKQSIGVEIN